MSNGRLGGSSSIGGFFQQKMDEFKGVDQERAKQEKLKRVTEKIQYVSGCDLDAAFLFYWIVSKEDIDTIQSCSLCIASRCSGKEQR